ncbi:unnamed protein product [Discosporangium mesarthrocarpum]
MQPPSVHTVDVDANLLHPDLVDDIELHLEVAASVGVMQFVVPGSTVSDSAKALELARQKPNVIFPTAGVHPYHVHDSGTINSGMEAIAALATNATGESRDLFIRPTLQFLSCSSCKPGIIVASVTSTEIGT